LRLDLTTYYSICNWSKVFLQV